MKKNRLFENIVHGIFLILGLITVGCVLLITAYLIISGIPAIKEIGLFNFLFGKEWASTAAEPKYGILPFILTSVYGTAGAILIGVPIGFFTAVYLSKVANKKVRAVIEAAVNLLAGIPSVIFGLFGMTIIVPFVRDYVSPTGVGYGILSASLVLGIMILPTIVSVSLDSLNSVSNTYYEGALALGATKEQATFKIMLPAAKSGILAGVVLAIGRAIGETMAVIMVIGGSPEMPESLFQSIRTMTANIAMGALELDGDALSALIATGVVLFVFTLILNVSFSLLKKDNSDKVADKKERRGAKK